MSQKQKIEIFSAGCPVCEDGVSRVKQLACPSCELTVLDMNEPAVAKKAKRLGVRSVPAVVIDDRLAACCTQGFDEKTLQDAGLGRPLGDKV
ncbi:MAG: thioredoxin family protein [Nitrospiria bacterium]